MDIVQDPIKIMDAKASNGIGQALLTAGFINIILAVHGTGTPTATIKFQASYAKDMPDFNAASGPTNSWDYVSVVDLEDKANIDGDTGISFAGANDNRQLELDINGARWVNAIISGHSAGAITVIGTLIEQ